MEEQVLSADYQVPTYEAPSETTWYHFLHGNVPGHQIDFIYRPAIPQGELSRQHFSHLARLMKYIEPRHGSAYAFTIGNLSRDDTQYEPGRGGIAIIFGLRIKGAKDHAGRQDPPFCHAMVCVDKNVDGASLYHSTVSFYHKLLPDQESQAEGSGWYHTFVQTAQQRPEALTQLIRGYIEDFEDLPDPGPSGLGLRWTTEGTSVPRRVVIVYPDDAPFEMLAHCAARIASVLVESDIRWTAISNGREQDLLGGTTVRLVPEREAVQEPADVVLLHIEQVPQEPADIAAQLFGAEEVRISQMPELRLNWRHMMARQGSAGAAVPTAAAAPATAGNGGSVRPPPMEDRPRPWAKQAEAAPEPTAAGNGDGLGLVKVVTKSEVPPAALPQPSLAAELKKKQRRQFMPIVGLGVVVALLGVLAAVWFGSAPPRAEESGAAPSAAAVASVVPTVAAKPSATASATAPAGDMVIPAGTITAAPSGAKTAAPAGAGTVKKGGTLKKGGGVIGGKLR